MAIELRHLRYFVAVAEEGHITRAAERLGMQQPPLSQQIKAVELELGVQLLRRKARGVEVTDAGRALLEDARAILANVDRAVETSRRASRGEEGRLCLGVTSTTPFHPLVVRAIGAFREACPMVALTLEECFSDELVDRLRSERMDAAFIRTSPAASDGLQVYRLLQEPMVLALPARHELASKETRAKPISFRRLAGETFILAGPPGTGLHDGIIAACQAAGFNPRVGNLGASTGQGPRIASTLSLVGAGLGITCVPLSVERMNIDGVTYRRLDGPVQPKAVLNLVARRGDPSSVVRQFLRIVRKASDAFDGADAVQQVR